MSDEREIEIECHLAAAQRSARRNGIPPERFVALFMAVLHAMMAEEIEEIEERDCHEPP